MLAGINKTLGVESEKKSSFDVGSIKKSLGIERKSVLSSTGDKLKAAGNKIVAGEVPTFQEESAFAKCCPNLTMKQVGQREVSYRFVTYY